MNNNPIFSKLEVNQWRQFAAVNLDIHPRLTVVTGTNGAGKSTILNIFTTHFGFSRPYLSTPRPNKEGGYVYDIGLHKYLSYLRDIEEEKDDKSKDLPPMSGNYVDVGRVWYSNGVESPIQIHEAYSQSYGLQISNQQAVVGLHVGSHRILTNYQPVQSISVQAVDALQAYQLFNQEILIRYGSGHTGLSPIYRMKESLIGMAAFGEGNTYLQSNERMLFLFKGFIEILRKVLPQEIGFQSLLIRLPDIVLQTTSGDFLLDSASGGINAIIEIAWQIYLFSQNEVASNRTRFVVTMDEPENHLHPSMQRAILPNLLSAFPDVQFIVATHSPFVVSAVEDSFVYVLNYIEAASPTSVGLQRALPRHVSSIKLDHIHKGGSASDILRDVLGVPVTTPEWVQDKIDRILDKYRGIPISNELLNSLRAELSNNGFGALYPESLSRLVSSNK